MSPPQYAGIVLNLVLLAVIIAVLYLFLQTRLGFVFRATGDNEDMVKACGVSCDSVKLLGLALSMDWSVWPAVCWHRIRLLRISTAA